MMERMQLVNFKSYEDTTVLFKPITLLCGGNSSGKTTILKSILLLKQSFEASGNNYLLINGPYTNNGLFTNVRRKTENETGKSEMHMSISFAFENSNSSFRDICKSLCMNHQQNEFQRFELHAQFSFSENEKIPQIGEIESSTITLIAFYSDNALHFAGDHISTVIHMKRCSEKQHYSIELNRFPSLTYSRNKYDYPFTYIDETWENCTCYFRGMQLVSLYKEQLSKKSTSALPVLYTIFRVLSNELGKVEYIGPLRETPLRQYLIQDVYSEIGVEGENTAHYLGQFGETKITTALPHNTEQHVMTLETAVAQWSSYMGIQGQS